MTMGERIKECRERLNMSQEELAKKMGYVARSSITRIEKGQNDIPCSKIFEFAKALETTPEYLMGLKEVKRMSTVSPETVVISKDDRNVVTIIAEMHSATLAETLYSSEADITLDDIRKKYKSCSIITVICEAPLEGVIYQYGNYNDDKWYNHGKTVGYA